MNPPIPEQLADDFRRGANAVNLGRQAMVKAMRDYVEDNSHLPIGLMEMYQEFAALTSISTDEPTISARTVRYYYENAADLPDHLFEKFMQGVFTFDHAATDKTLTGERGIVRGQAIEWAIQHAEKGKKVATVAAMWLHFARDNGKPLSDILLGKWRREVDRLWNMKLPEKAPKEWLQNVSYHMAELRDLIGKGFDSTIR